MEYPGSRPITRVQSQSATTAGTNAATLTITLGANATVGNALLVAFNTTANQVLNKIVFGSNTRMLLAGSNQSTTIIVGIAYALVREVSASIIITLGASSPICAVAVEYNAPLILPDIPPLGNSSTATTTNSTGTLAATNFANELIVAAMGAGFATTTNQTAWLTNPTNSFASVAQTSTSLNTAADKEVAFLERIVTATGAYSTAGTQTSAIWANVIGSFVGG